MIAKAKVLAAGAVAAVTLSGCGFTGLYGAPLPGGADLGDHPFTITASFDDALDLVPQSAVKVNDVAIGKVTKISLDGWSAKVTMDVNDSVKMDSNATAEIAQTSLLGEKYVSLNPPARGNGKRLGNGDNITIDHTRSAAEVEQVLGALSLLLNEGGLRQVRTIGDELVTALKGREPEIKDLLSKLNSFVGKLDTQKGTIITALENVDRLAITLNRNKKVITDAIDTFPAALKVLAQERPKFTKLLTSLDNLGTVATRVIKETKEDFTTSLEALQPALTQLRAAGDALPKSLTIIGTFPFPLGVTRSVVKGDYANLSAPLNLDVGETLCQGSANQLSKTLCDLLINQTNTPIDKLTKRAGATGNAAREEKLQPMIIGSGR